MRTAALLGAALLIAGATPACSSVSRPSLQGVALPLQGETPGASAPEPRAAPEAPGPQGDGKIPVEVHGFLLGAFSGRTTGAQAAAGDGGDFVLAEERLRLEISGAAESDDASFLVRGDLFHDSVTEVSEVDLREAYARYSTGPFDLRLGRQIVTWGVGDLLFVNDVFPKDWDSFFSGRPMEYLKLGVDGLRTQFSSEVVTVDLLAIPSFTPDALPSPERFPLADPLSAVPDQRRTEPVSSYSNTELALRLYRRVEEFDVSLYAYRGFWRTPGVRLDDPVSPTTVTRFYPDLSVVGASAQRSLRGGVVSLETGYYDSRQDRSGDDPGVPNSQWRALAGYQYQPWEDLTVGVQAYGEVMADYGAYRGALPAGSPREDQFRKVVSVRLTQLLEYQTWTLSLFAAYSPGDEDTFVRPEVSHRVTDSLSVSLGANLFGGRRRTTYFGQFDRGDDVFLNVRYDF